MKLLHFVLWLSIGAVIGWFASRISQERKHVPVVVQAEDVDDIEDDIVDGENPAKL